MADGTIRTAVVGPFTWFENHFPEGWRDDHETFCLDVNENDYSWLILLHNFKPEITLFYRPELYPGVYLRTLSGYKVAFMSEPLPTFSSQSIHYTAETSLRITVYSRMQWSLYDWIVYYDQGKQQTAEHFRFPIDEYAPLPIDTSTFFPATGPRPLDVCFVGKPTAHRIGKLDFLRSSKLKFKWVAHGCSGPDLAALFRQSKLVLNVHADGVEAFEPRVYLGAACGALVLSEPLSSRPTHFIERIIDGEPIWNESVVRRYVDLWNCFYADGFERDRQGLSTRAVIRDLFERQRRSHARAVGHGDTRTRPSEETFSFVVASDNDLRFDRFRRHAVSTFGKGTEIIRVKEVRSLAGAYNEGASQSRADWIIFCHDDVIFLDENSESIFLHAMQSSDLFGCCGTRRLVSGNWYDAGVPFIAGSVVGPDIRRSGRYRLEVFGVEPRGMVRDAVALDGIVIGCRRKLFDKLGGFDAGNFGDFHGYDIDFSFRAALAGLRVVIDCNLLVLHLSSVASFSDEKHQKWEIAQRTFERLHRGRLSAEAGKRGHETVSLGRDPRQGLVALRKAANAVRE